MDKKSPGKGLTYEGSGVNYGSMDPFKVMAQKAARATAGNIRRLGMREVASSRGESAYLVEDPSCYWAHVEEGLGTKNLVADAMRDFNGRSFYDSLAQDTVAMIVNDMVTLGALPVSVAMHLAVGSSDWFSDTRRCRELVDGWKKACDLAGCCWGGGETPTLPGIVDPKTALLSGSAVGVIEPKSRRILGGIQDGDEIITVESSGIHANGLTLARQIAQNLPDGYLTKISGGRTYGESLLDPTHIYVGIIERCQELDIEIHYAANITGHGWRKLMRLDLPFVYRIDSLPAVPPVLEFICREGPVNSKEAYGNFNMGAGFALIVSPGNAKRVIRIAKGQGFKAVIAGSVEAAAIKKVIIEPLDIEYGQETLRLR